MINKKLTEEYEFVKGFDPLAAAIYEANKVHGWTILDITEFTGGLFGKGLKSSEIRASLKKAKTLLKNRDVAWMYELSNQTKNALIRNKYTTFQQLYHDVIEEKIILIHKPTVGVQIATEITDFLHDFIKNNCQFKS